MASAARGAGQALRQLYVSLGFEVEDKGLQRADRVFNSFMGRVASAAAVFGSVRGAMRLLNEQIKEGAQIKLLADEFQMSTRELQKYKFAAESVGLTTKELVSAMTTISNHMGMTTTLTGMAHSIKLFGQYGLSVRDAGGKMKDFPTILGDIADKMKTMDNAAQRVRMADELLGRQAGGKLIPLLMQGSGAIKEMFGSFDKLNLAMSDDFVQSSFVMSVKLKTLNQTWKVFKSELALGAYPWLKKIIDAMSKVVSWGTHMARVTTGMTTAWHFFGIALAATIVRIAGGLKGLLSLFFRFGLPLILVGALYLIFDDLYALLNGYPSVIGEVLTRLYGADKAREFTERLKAAWEQVKASFQAAIPAFKKVGEVLLDFLPKAVGWLAKLLDMFATLVDKLTSGKSAFSAAIGNLLLADDDYKARVEGYMRDGDTESMAKTKALGMWYGDVKKYDKQYMDENGPLFSGGVNEARAPKTGFMGPQVGTRSVQVTNKFDVNVEGGPDAGKQIVDGASRALSQSDLGDAAAQGALYGGL